MRADVVLQLDGSSPLAGTYRGIRTGRTLRRRAEVGARHRPPLVSFLHAGDQIIVRHHLRPQSLSHAAEMVLLQRFTFDGPTGKLARITVEPEDAGLFDYVVQTALGDTRAS